MKALTICQPYATLIVRGEKRVENRTWYTNHRQRIYIHAGKSRQWLDVTFNGNCNIDGSYPHLGDIEDMPFGAIVGIATLADCVHIDKVGKGMVGQRYPSPGRRRQNNSCYGQQI